MLWCRFKQCLGTSTVFLVERCSETGCFRHLSNNVFGVGKFHNTKAMRVIFFSKCLKFNLDFKNLASNSEKVFCFWDNCIWIGIVKMSLLRTGCFPSAANVLTSCTKILQVNREDFFAINWLGNDHWRWWRCCGVDFKRSSARLPYCLSKGPLQRDFLDIYLTTFSESVISEIRNLRG